jgi:lipoate-protein ligase A
VITVRVDPPAAGDENMAADLALAAAASAAAVESASGRRSDTDGAPASALLRLYTWNPPAISIGYHQDEREFDQAKLRGAGLGFVRRPTGGRAVLHDDELTYCIAAPSALFRPAELCRSVGEALSAGLARMGIDADLETGSPDLRAHYASPSGSVCFTLPSRYELLWRGRKLAGSAQRRIGTVLLQHGSLLLGPGHARIADYLAPGGSPRTAADTSTDTPTDTAIDAGTILGRRVGFDEAAGAVAAGFREVFQNESIETA